MTPLPRRLLTLFLAGLGLTALIPATAHSSGSDRDRDGLTNKRELRLGTSPRKADTDRDTLRDGREVKVLKTNPRRADSDGDGVRDGREIREALDPLDDDSDDDGTSDRFERKGTIVSIGAASDLGTPVTVRVRGGAEIEFLIDVDTFLEGADRDADGILTLADFQEGDRVEANLSEDGTRALTLELESDDDDMNEAEGRVTAITGDTFTVTGKRGRTWEFVVDSDTFLRAPDRDGSGTVTPSDIEVGDEIEAHLSADGTRALSLEVEYDDDEYGDDDGYGDDDEREVEGRIQSIDYDTGSVTIERRGWTTTVVVDGSTFLRAPVDVNGSGTTDLADFQVGDRVEGRLAADGTTLVSLKLDGPDDDEGDGPDYGEVEGSITSISGDSVTIRRFDGSEVTLAATPGTEFEAPDRDSSGNVDLSDFEVGDRVEAKYDEATNVLRELEYEGIEDEADDDEADDDEADDDDDDESDDDDGLEDDEDEGDDD